jgi:hypothetical protein
VNVAINCHGCPNSSIALHAADGDGYVMNHAEALTMVRKGVMKATADIES